MARQPVPQLGLLLVTSGEDALRSRMHVPLVAILAVYFLHLLGQCTSDGVVDVSPDNYTTVGLDTAQLAPSNTEHGDGLPRNRLSPDPFNQTEQTAYGAPDPDAVTSATGGLPASADAESGTEHPVGATNASRLPVAVKTDKPRVYTHRDIYIRGHLLRHPPPGPKTFRPRPESDGSFRAANTAGSFRGEPDGSSSRRKRKPGSSKARYYNYKMLYDTIKGAGTGKRKTEFYAWIFGAAMLGLGSLTTVSSCFVFCFCSDKVRKRREARARRGNDKGGEYQRVESVSSIVDNAGDHSELYDDQMDSVTII